MAGNVLDLATDFDKKFAVNPRAAFYKKPMRRSNYSTDSYQDDTPQELRRQRLLCEQKRNRDATFNSMRGLVDEVLHYDENYEEEMEIQQEENKRRRRRVPSYANQLMMSEWMIEIPPDLLEKWLMVPCPEGRRVLLIACKGATRAYDKRGILLGKFSSALPGGTYQHHNGSCTILDCIWMRGSKTYYTLDVLAWSNQPFLNCDTEFRFFWLKTRLEETEGLKDRGSANNSYPILPLPNYPCSADTLTILESLKKLPSLDGLLFYHSEAYYKHGRTPLVNWLKPFMLADVLGDEIFSGVYEKPEDYVDIKDYIQKSTKRKKGKKKEPENLMEITNTTCTTNSEEMDELFMT